MDTAAFQPHFCEQLGNGPHNNNNNGGYYHNNTRGISLLKYKEEFDYFDNRSVHDKNVVNHFVLAALSKLNTPTTWATMFL